MENQQILFALKLDRNGGGELIDESQIMTCVQKNELIWVHLDANQVEARSYLRSTPLDLHIIEALLVGETRPRMVQNDDGVLLILRGINKDYEDIPEDLISIRIWLEKNVIVTTWKQEIQAVDEIKNRLLKSLGPKSVGQFSYMLSSVIAEHIAPFLTQLDDCADDIEEKILEDADTALRADITEIQRKAIVFKRYLSPQRDAINQLNLATVSWLKENHKQELAEVSNHLTRFVEDLDAIKKHAQLTNDVLSNAQADKLNNNMYMLSVITAIFLPLSFLTGLLGINIAGMPGVHSPYAFWLFSSILLIILVIQLLIFKRNKWF